MSAQLNKINIKSALCNLLQGLVICLMLNACASKSVTVPDWYQQAETNSTQSNSKTMTSAAQGRSLDEAKKAALDQISSQIWVKLNSSSESSDTQVVNQINDDTTSYNHSRFASDVNTKTAGIVFTDVNYTKVEKIDGVYYVQASVKRSSIVRELESEITELNDKAKTIVNKLKYGNIFTWYFDNANFYKIKNQAQLKINILHALKSNAIPSITEIDYVVKKLVHTKSKILVAIKSNDASIAKAIANKFAKKEIKTTFSLYSTATNRLNVAIKSQNKKIGDIFVTTLFINIDLKDRNENTLMSNEIISSGNSISNYQISKKAAIEKFITEIKNKNIYSIFGYGDYH